MKVGDDNEGYSAGFGDGDWLTIPGSARRTPTLFMTEEDAAEHARTTWPGIFDQLVVRRVRATYHPGVTITSMAFRVIGS